MKQEKFRLLCQPVRQVAANTCCFSTMHTKRKLNGSAIRQCGRTPPIKRRARNAVYPEAIRGYDADSSWKNRRWLSHARNVRRRERSAAQPRPQNARFATGFPNPRQCWNAPRDTSSPSDYSSRISLLTF